MKFARIQSDTVADITLLDPSSFYHPDLAKDFVECPDCVEFGWSFDGKDWIPPQTENKETGNGL